VTWQEAGTKCSARWISLSGVGAPKRVVVADDRITAERAYRLACEGTAILWRGDYQNARQLHQAVARRFDARGVKMPPELPAAERFHRHRMGRAQRARVLGSLILPFEADHGIPLRRSPDAREACAAARGEVGEPYLASLSETLGLIGAHQWRLKGVAVPALGESIHPHYGVFAPVRGEYVDLVAQAPLPATDLAFDIGTGTGVLAVLLARRGVRRIVATDSDARALACAADNVARLGLAGRIEVVAADLFPPGRAGLLVCNPPWLPGRAGSPLEAAIYDPDSRMLRGFLAGAAAHLEPGGEAWLILSDLAEHLGLRAGGQVESWIAAAGLVVRDRLEARPRHPKAGDALDPFYKARRLEVTRLWRLAMGS
jgi:hypothetical protein